MKRVALTEAMRKAKFERDQSKIKFYRNLTKKVLSQKHNGEYTVQALADTTSLLEINPEFNAVWNFRRHILLKLFNGEINRKEALSNDLKMVMAQLKMYPKCYWLWNHRSWCLGQLEENGEANWEYELAIVLKLLEMDSRNFHGWHYRRYVVEYIEKAAVDAAEDRQKATIAGVTIDLGEFQYTTAKINKNVSNFSAWHNRANLIPKIFKQLEVIDSLAISEDLSAVVGMFSSPTKLLNHELELVRTGMYMDPEDTSVWLYMQWLLTDKLMVEDLKKEQTYSQLLHQQLQDVNELNDLEKEDHVNHCDNVWCLKSIVFLKALLKHEEGCHEMVDDEISAHLQTLARLDPLRKGHYLDQLAGSAPLLV